MTGEPFSDHSNVLTFVEQPKTTSASISILPSLLHALESDAHYQEVRHDLDLCEGSFVNFREVLCLSIQWANRVSLGLHDNFLAITSLGLYFTQPALCTLFHN